jgi:hypothetical protein
MPNKGQSAVPRMPRSKDAGRSQTRFPPAIGRGAPGGVEKATASERSPTGVSCGREGCPPDPGTAPCAITVAITLTQG